MKTFEDINKEFISNPEYMKLKFEYHHGITRLEHILRVSEAVYKYTTKHNLDYISATRAALLHDFFLKEEMKDYHGLKVGAMHPIIAANKSKELFGINEKEENMIKSHMFPLGYEIPKSKEALILTFIDKQVAVFEYLSYKFTIKKARQKVNYLTGFIFILILNIIMMDKR